MIPIRTRARALRKSKVRNDFRREFEPHEQKSFTQKTPVDELKRHLREFSAFLPNIQA